LSYKNDAQIKFLRTAPIVWDKPNDRRLRISSKSFNNVKEHLNPNA